MHIMVTITYPPHKRPEVQELFQKVPELPDSVKRIAIYGTMDGMAKSYVVFEIDDSRVDEGLTGMLTRLAGYDVVEGFRWKIELVRRAEPAET